ncbi:SdrD B-like domain-containing protein, partial [Fibrella arboris]|uniref:SdrD B-like domain-containing protein n=1 Tax=Fibrella arboris TaxID=3242486 RepID=UPI003521C7B7
MISSAVQAQVTGFAYRDFNANGTYQSIPASGTYTYGEPGVSGITVVATTPGASFTTTTSSTGSYAFTSAQLPANTAVRLVFSGFSAANFDYDGGQLGTGGTSTSVQFVTAGASTTANFGLNYPREYCQAIGQTNVITSCFNAVGTLTDAAIIGFVPTQINDPAQPFVSGTTGGTNQFAQTPPMSESALATQAQVGTVNGFAYHRRSKILFAAAFARTASPVRNGLGTIYAINLSGATATTAVFATIANVGSATGTGGAVAAGNVGRIGLGNIALSEDEQTLYAINLNTRALVSIPLGTGTPTAGASTSVTIPAPADCINDYRPFAIRVHRGKIYIGVTCGSGTIANLKGYVYEYNGSTFTTVLTIPFDYSRADDGVNDVSFNANYYGFGTFPNYIRNNLDWVGWNTYPDLTAGPTSAAAASTSGSGPVAKTQPWLTDITFDGENMILGIRSRLADAVNESFWVVGGDILRACSTTPGSWTLESNGVCGGIQSFVGTAPPNIDPYTGRVGMVDNSRGPGGYEYYWGDDGFEGEASQGSILQIPGSPNVIVSQVDAIGHTGQVGVMSMSNRSGQITAAGNIFFGYTAGGGTANNIGKSNGLGAMDITCNAAPIEIGNRLWVDTNKNGIQDPGEAPLAGVTVQLFTATGTTPIATTVTDSNGLYTFRSTTTTALTYNTAYQLRIANAQTPLTGYVFTSPTTGSNRLLDSDFTPGAATATVSFTTGGVGQNNFSFDAGVVPCSFTATTTASSNAVCIGQPIVLTTQVTPSSSYTYSVTGPAGVVITGGTTGTATVTNLNSGVNTFTVTITNSPTCFTTNIVSVTASAATLLTLSASQSAICVGQALTLSTTLGGVLPALGPVVFNTVDALGALLNPVTSNVFSPTATTTFIAQVPILGGLVSSCPVTVIVNPPPTVAAASTSLCVGSPLNLTGILGQNNILTGLTNTLLGSVPATVVAGINTYSIVSTNANGCSTTTPISVTGVNPPVVNPIALSLCVGANLDLTSLSGLTGLTNVFRTGGLLGLGTLLGTPTSVSIGAGVNLFNVVSTAPTGCTTATPISVTGVNAPVVAPIALSLCVGTNLDLTSLSGLTGLTNVFRTGGLLGLGTLLGTPTSVSVGAGVNLFNVVSTAPTGCTTATPISVTGVNAPTIVPIALSLCVGANLDLTSLSGLTGLTNVFRTGNLLGLGTLLGTPTSVSVGAGVNLFNVVSTAPTGCTTATPISVTGINPPVLAPIALSLCVGTNLDLTSLSGLTGLTNVFRTGGLLGLGNLLGTPTSVSIGAGMNLFNVVSTAPTGCTTATPISVTGVNPPVLAPIALSLCVGTNLDLTSLSGLTGLTNVFRTGGLLGLGTLLSTPTSVSIGAGVNLFNVVSTAPTGCTTATPISVTGVNAPVVAPIALSLCVGTNLDLTSLSGLTGLTNVFRTGGVLGLGTLLGTPTSVSIGAGVNLFNVVSTAPTGCTTATPISVTGIEAPVVAPIALSLCVGANLDLTSLSGLTGLTNVFRTGGLLGLGTLLGTPTSVSIGAGVNLFNVVSTAPTGCTTATPISVTGVNAPVVAPIALSLCVGANLDLTSLSGLTGLTNVFRTGGLLGLGTLLGTPTSVSIGAGVNLFNVVSTAPTGCTTATPISVTGINAPVVGPIALSLCVGANLDLTSLSGLTGLTNVFRTGGLLGLGNLLGTPTSVSIGAGVNLFNVVSTAPTGCTTATPISVTGVNAPVVAPIALSLCVGTNLDLTSLSGLTGLTNVFRTGGVLGLGTLLGTPTSVSIGAGVNLFNVVSTAPTGCTTATPISVTGIEAPVVAPIALSLCVGANLDLTSLSGLTGLTNVFRTGGLLGLGTLLGTPTSVSIGAGVNLFNVVSTAPTGCTTATPISVTGINAPVVGPIALSLCVGANLDLTSLSGLTGLTNVFRTGGLLGLGNLLGTPTSVSIGAGVNLFNVVSTAPTGCTTATPISVTGVNAPVVAPIALSLCVGTNLDLTSLSGLTGLTNVFRTGGLLGLGNLLGTPTSVSIGAGVNLFNVVSTAPTGCTTATPISVTGVNAPVVAPIALSLCVGTNLDLTSLSGLTGLTNVFRTGNLL